VGVVAALFELNPPSPFHTSKSSGLVSFFFWDFTGTKYTIEFLVVCYATRAFDSLELCPAC
jgi:hypothetical protein